MNDSIEVKLTHIKDGKVEVIREIIITPFWSPPEAVMEDLWQLIKDERDSVIR